MNRFFTKYSVQVVAIIGICGVIVYIVSTIGQGEGSAKQSIVSDLTYWGTVIFTGAQLAKPKKDEAAPAEPEQSGEAGHE